MDINIYRDHEVVKSNMGKGFKYFGEVSSDGKPQGIGLVAKATSEGDGTYKMFENIDGSLTGNGMTIAYDEDNAYYAVGFSTHSDMVGPRLTFYHAQPLACYNVGSNGMPIGLSVSVDYDGTYTIRKHFGDGDYDFREVVFSEDTLYFSDNRRKVDNRVEAFTIGKDFAFKYHGLELNPYVHTRGIMPSKVSGSGAYFNFSGGVQICRDTNAVEYKYKNATKTIEFDDKPHGHCIRYYSGSEYYFGWMEGHERVGVGCYTNGTTDYMGGWYNNQLSGACLTRKKGSKDVYTLAYMGDGVRWGTYLEFHEKCMYICYERNGKRHKYCYKIYTDTLDIEKLEDATNKVLEKKTYPFREDDEESLRQLEKMIEEEDSKANIPTIPLSNKERKALAYYTYTNYEPRVVITGFRMPHNSMRIPYCAQEIAPRAFADEKAREIIGRATITGNIEVMGESAFDGCKILYKLEFIQDSKLTEIKKRTFADTNIDFVSIPDSVKKIGPEAFAGCERLTRAFVPDDCEIDPTAFPEHCTLVTSSEVHQKVDREYKAKHNIFYKIVYGIQDLFGGKKRREKKRKYASTNPDKKHEVKKKDTTKSTTKETKSKPTKVKKKWHMPKIVLPAISFDWLGSFTKWFWISILVVGACIGIHIFVMSGGELPTPGNFDPISDYDAGYVCRFFINLHENGAYLPFILQILLFILFIPLMIIGFVLDIVLTVLVFVLFLVIMIVLFVFFFALNIIIIVAPAAFMILRTVFAFRDDVSLPEKICTIILLIVGVVFSCVFAWFIFFSGLY